MGKEDIKIRPGETRQLSSGKIVTNEGKQDVHIRRKDLAAYTKDGKNGKLRVKKGDAEG